jgi:YbbR domain-containing protein
MAKRKVQKALKVESVVAAVKGLVAMGREDEFLKACQESAFTVGVSDELITLLKAHLEPKSVTMPVAATKAAPAKKVSAKRSFASVDGLVLAARVRECDDAENC